MMIRVSILVGMLGVHFAVTGDQEQALLAADAAGDADAVEELLGDIEESWAGDGLKVDTDKAWDAIHRHLTPPPRRSRHAEATAPTPRPTPRPLTRALGTVLREQGPQRSRTVVGGWGV